MRLQGVEERQEGRISPCEHEAKVVVGNVNGLGVPVFVQEEVNDIDGVKDKDDLRINLATRLKRSPYTNIPA